MNLCYTICYPVKLGNQIYVTAGEKGNKKVNYVKCRHVNETIRLHFVHKKL